LVGLDGVTLGFVLARKDFSLLLPGVFGKGESMNG
jgi:hypothetical protein